MKIWTEFKKLIKFFIDDTKSDIVFVQKTATRLQEGKPVFDDEQKKNLKTAFTGFSFVEIIKENWIWLLVIMFAVLCGWVLAAKYYQGVCNQFIYDTYILPNIQRTNTSSFFYNLSNIPKP